MELKTLLHTTSRYIAILEQNGIKTLKDFFNYFPRTYEDRSQTRPLNELIFDAKGITATKGQILQKKQRMRGGKTIYDIKFTDENGNIGYISIYNSAFLAGKLVEKSWYIIVGKPQYKYGKIVFNHPDVVPATAPENPSSLPFVKGNAQGDETYNSGRIFPVYSEMQGIKPGWFAQKVWNNLDNIDQCFSEYLPNEFLQHFGLLDVVATVKNLHYPESDELRKKALYRLFFDRLLRIQLFSLMNKLDYQGSLETPPLSENPHWDELKPILNQLSFALTIAQKKVIIQILEDFYRGKPMLRLLQ
ncbi:MAG: hypothetical protein LBP53_00080 [Candidatus Peribacteria bacterium]|jgi:ATP-dependent DNA helicase RecG|nr:hypothetical protein [Candidatus Peribacteria bacterium]